MNNFTPLLMAISIIVIIIVFVLSISTVLSGSTPTALNSTQQKAAAAAALQKEQAYNLEIQQGYNNMLNLQYRYPGINVTPLQKLLANGTRIIAVPLTIDLQNSTNASQLTATIQSFCLYNGCERNSSYYFLPPYVLNYHMQARYTVQSDWLILTWITNHKWPLNVSWVNNTKTNLTIASNELFTDVNWSNYKPASNVTIWSHIDNASKFLTLLNSEPNRTRANLTMPAVVTEDQNEIQQYRNETSYLQKRYYGMNVTSLGEILSGAETYLMDPLIAGLHNSTNQTEQDLVTNTYCLNNGCVRSTTAANFTLFPVNAINYHLNSRYTLQQDWLLLSQITNYKWPINETLVNDTKANLTIANYQLYNVTGVAAYTPIANTLAWDALNNANKDIVLLGSPSNASKVITISPSRVTIHQGQNITFSNTTYNIDGYRIFNYSISPSGNIIEVDNAFEFNSVGNYTLNLTVYNGFTGITWAKATAMVHVLPP